MKIVVALGGNALGKTPEEQKNLVKETSASLVDLIEMGHDLVISHGNGPQVGMINLAMDIAHKSDENSPSMPFPECGAMSQGYIGYHLGQAINNELRKRGVEKECATIVTECIVAENDSAFENPTKPIGSFYSESEAKELASKNGYVYKEDAGRGYRRVVASPKPLKIVEAKTIKKLVDSGVIVIASGGGGIPVIEKNNELIGVAAVIDKDFSSRLLATELDADMLMILTAVDKVCINFNQENQTDLNEITIDEAKEYIAKEEFAKGSMLPKVEACIEFVESTGGHAVITSLLGAKDALNGKNGTLIKK